ncbi:phage anti-repressor protein [Chryseobacterium sp. 7]|uniref:antA/AntB antirepressor family protein n=1 Tax=Chryseobacterium sp. 7 TaxID=2035214 RepID=UPI000EB1DA43|nr:antA/AntB antirepressor family protein [Chryseobacterium sp. 7]RLJ33877.1 phage anti-repressor protein [Chryseobacterium sp. 7]
MNELIKITEHNGNKAVSARELHSYLESKQDFSNWIKNRINKYGFIENQDFQRFDKIIETGGRLIEYALTIDCAKELSMVEGNEKGKEARKYFIDVEKAHNNNLATFYNDPFIQLRMSQIQQQQQIQALESKVNMIEAKTTTRPDYFSVMGYAIMNKVTVGLRMAASIGKKASSICKKNGFPTDEVPDPRFGRVKLYPSSVLDKIFSETIFS